MPLDSITQTLKSSHSVLIPSDPSARLIELICLLNSHWNQCRLDHFPICLVSQAGNQSVAFIRLLTKWMPPAFSQSSFNNSKRRRIKSSDQGLFRLRQLRIFDSIEALDSDSSIRHPRVIIAIPMSMKYEFARTLFSRMASTEGTLIVLNSPVSALAHSSEKDLGYLVHQLVTATAHLKAKDPKASEKASGKTFQLLHLNTTIKVELRRKVLLEGTELEDYLAEERRANQEKAKMAAMPSRSHKVTEDRESGDSLSKPDSDMDVNVDGQDLMGCSDWDDFADDQQPTGIDIYVKGSAGKCPGGGRLPRFKMFPFKERQRTVDSYGEVVDVNDWLKIGDALGEGTSQVNNEASNAENEDSDTQVRYALLIDSLNGDIGPQDLDFIPFPGRG
ncbi:hypothetical protein O181_003285 [Austropuccinia psidii MF-1]|uniref:Cleavage and polyadenylation specificity factor subunit 2 n=1 Tax=Austropuccinia psidii MF-1 TaxID=1389203 RepID=A0A9Q3GDR2_9BASI|nr:hypothetical protein [Austropuccinia psidii MF-1]